MRVILLTIGILWGLISEAEELLVIASPDVPAATISMQQLADIYALRKTTWSNQTQIVPVNRESDSDARKEFAGSVFGSTPQDLAELWDKLRFQGKQPPLTQISDQAVLGFVRNVPGAIGYIRADEIPTGVKVLLRLP